MSIQTFRLPAGQVATVTAVSSALLYRLREGGENYAASAIAAAGTASVGPFADARAYAVDSELPASVALTTPDPVSDGDALSAPVLTNPIVTGGTFTGATLAAIAALDLDNDVRFITSDGAPDDAGQATLSRNPAGDENGLTFTAVAYGAGGNAITIAYVDPGAADAELSVDVDGSAIVVNLATDESEVITSTAAEILAAIEASAAAAALVTVVIDGADSGGADDGSGVVTALAAAPMTGGAGTGIGTCGPGSLCIDYDGADLYVNGGTLAVPVWKLVTRAA